MYSLVIEITQDGRIPWFRILFSRPLSASVMAYFCVLWIWFFLITDVPSYYRQVLKTSVLEGGFYSTLPILMAIFTATSAGFLCDYMLQRGWNKTTTRKFFSSIGFFPSAIVFIAISYTKEEEIVQAVAYISLCTGLCKLNYNTFIANIIDLSPTYTGILIGIANTVGACAGLGAPMLTGFVTNNDPSWRRWQLVFFVNAGLCVLGGLYFFAFGSSDVEEWDPVYVKEDQDTKITAH